MRLHFSHTNKYPTVSISYITTGKPVQDMIACLEIWILEMICFLDDQPRGRLVDISGVAIPWGTMKFQKSCVMVKLSGQEPVRRPGRHQHLTW